MSFPYISGNRTYHFLFSVQNDIENKNGFQCPGCKHHVLMDWILGKAARDGMRIRDIVSAVIVHNGTARCDSRQNTLAASGITSKKVRFNKSLRYNQICLACKAVKFNSVSVRTCAHIRKTSPVTVMDCNFFPVHNLRPKTLCHLLICGCPVTSGGYENRNASPRISSAHRLKQKRHRNSAGHRTCMVRSNNHNRTRPPGQSFQPGRIIRMPERRLYNFVLRLFRNAGRQSCFYHGAQFFLQNFNCYMLLSIRK